MLAMTRPLKEALERFGHTRPVWADSLVMEVYKSTNDYYPYYWVGDGKYKKITSKNKFHHGHRPDAKTVLDFRVKMTTVNRQSKRGRFGIRGRKLITRIK